MAQIFPAGTNAVVRAVIVGVPLSVCALIGALYAVEWSPWATREWVPISQPVPFSHKHHVGQLGIDCRYCHTGVEKSAYAGIPPTETCMTCHSQLYTDQAMLQPVRESLATGTPIRWNRVHDLPDFVYFNHSIHVNKGIGCTSCHGRENQMQLVWQDQTLYMSWCLPVPPPPGEVHRAARPGVQPGAGGAQGRGPARRRPAAREGLPRPVFRGS